MFVRAGVHVRVGEGGQIIEPALAGKFICPMHPEVVKDRPGQCDVCGMDLVSAEALGFAEREAPSERVLAIPQTAVLLTGRRAVVYVETTNEAGEDVYEGRDVELGPRAGDWYVVKSGLAEGERVVVRGAFQIDSALQIQARPSMMQPAAEIAASQSPSHMHHAESASEQAASTPRAVSGATYHQQMRPVLAALVDLTENLSGDNAEAAPAAMARMRDALGRAEPDGLDSDDARLFAERVNAIRQALPAPDAKGLSDLRGALAAINTAIERYLRTFGHDQERPFVRLFCPMAFDNRGASWLQLDDKVRNPYFGSRMYRCGEKRGEIAADGSEVR
jgi:Cu(I)/Ag(I) efflux system membrane fusion protein